jgi:YVTN family beta-propeller protein
MKSCLLRVVSVFGTALFTLVGCTNTQVSSSNSSGTMGISSDDAFVYAVDTDNGVVAIIDAKAQAKITAVPVGKSPERIAVGPDDTLYVANRGSRSVSVIRRGTTDAATWKELTQLNVAVEPVGLVLSPDGRTLYVVNSTSLQTTDFGTVMAFDTSSLQMNWELPVGPEPRGMAIVSKDRAVVTLFKQGDVVLVDLSKPEVVQSGTTLYQLVNAPPPVSNQNFPAGAGPVPGEPASPTTFHARGMSEVVAGPNDGRVYALTSLSRETTLQDPPPSSSPGDAPPSSSQGPTYGSGGPGNCAASVVSAGVVTFQDEGATPVVDSLQTCGTQGGIPPTLIVTGSSPLQGPSAVAIDRTGNWMFIVGRNSNNVVVLSTAPAAPQAQAPSNAPTPIFPNAPDDASNINQVIGLTGVGSGMADTGGPSGIALSHDGTKAYVYNSFAHTLSVLESSGGSISQSTSPVAVAQDVLSPDAVTGREQFFSAIDPGMTSAGVGIACASCHLEGREDGHVWHFTSGPRRTPSVAGRATMLTPPFHWSGEFATLSDFLNDTIGQRMGGTNAAPGQTNPVTTQIAAYINSLEPLDNPYQQATPSDAQVRGQAVFALAGCTTCHSGTAINANGQTVQLFTNNGFANVGTLSTNIANPDDASSLPACNVSGVAESSCLNVPSLLGLARTAPYLHDGSAATLNDRLRVGQSTNQHGQTANLSDQQLSDLVAYLNSL